MIDFTTLIKQLTPAQGRRIYLRFYTNCTYRQIAQIEGISCRVAYKTVTKGLNRLKIVIERTPNAPTGGVTKPLGGEVEF